MVKSKAKLAVLIILLILAMTNSAFADNWYGNKGDYYIVYNTEGKELFMTASEIAVDDEYISGDNKLYRLTEVDENKLTAKAKFIEDVQLPDVGDLDIQTMETSKLKRKIVLYCTHSGESYKPTDGIDNKPSGQGGIYAVADNLKEGLEKNGVEVTFDKTQFQPHDASAYRRSRQVATQMIREHQPGAKLDIHRDATPAQQYTTNIKGTDASKIRMVIGRRNQNSEVNKNLALKIKATADKMYPGLIKDIYMGGGDYNQDLSPRSLLLEMGTYSLPRERVEKSATMFADVITASLFGGTTERDAKDGSPGVERTEGIDGIGDDSSGAGRGILWVLGLLVVGGLGFLFLSSSGKEIRAKISRFTKEEFANFLGSSESDDDDSEV